MASGNPVPPIVLLQYGPHSSFGSLPTFDPHCLVAQTYLKLAKVPFIENNCNNPKASPINKLPVLSINQVKTVVHTDIFSELSAIGYNLDENLSESEKNDIEAWSSLVQHRLANAQIYNWWAESSNYDEMTSLVYSRVLSFPLNFILPGRYKKNALAQLTATGFAEERVAYEEAAKCYKALSSKLGDKQYMMGANPTSLDAVVFGFLATQFLPNLPQRKLHYLISQHTNLIDYINRILTTYFSAKAPVVVDTEPAQRWLKTIEDEKAEQRRTVAEAPVKDSSSAWAIALGIGATVLFMSTQNLQLLVFYKQLSSRFSPKAKPAPARKFSLEQEEERSKWFGGMPTVGEESSDPHQPATDAIARAATDPDVNPMKEVHRFAPDDDAVVYIGDDGKAYDWDEQYLEEMETGSDIPEDHEDLGEDEEEEYD